MTWICCFLKCFQLKIFNMLLYTQIVCAEPHYHSVLCRWNWVNLVIICDSLFEKFEEFFLVLVKLCLFSLFTPWVSAATFLPFGRIYQVIGLMKSSIEIAPSPPHQPVLFLLCQEPSSAATSSPSFSLDDGGPRGLGKPSVCSLDKIFFLNLY